MISKLYSAPLIRRIYPKAYWEVETVNKEVFLTFDDGPHPEITPWVMDQLDEINAKATFFCIGDNVLKYPKTFNEILNRGHAVGNHTFNHLNGFKTPTPVYLNNIEKCETLFSSKLFRPPYGRMRRSQSQHIHKHTFFKIVMWSLLSRDYEQNLSIESMKDFLQKSTTKGSIIVFHDSEKAWSNLQKLLPAYLVYLNENGFAANSIQL